MFFRLIFLLTLFLGLATGPVCNAGSCAAPAVEMKCGGCCGETAEGCCAKGGAPAEQKSPVAAGSVELKQALMPVLVCLGLQPAIVAPPAYLPTRTLARLRVQPRLEVTCIRLI